MTENIIAFTGSFLKHVIGVLLLCWRRMLRAGVVAFAIGVTLALLVAVIATGQAFPGMMAVVAALLFGAALGYGIALTVLVEEFALGIVDLIHLAEGDAKKVAHITETLAEREVGEMGKGLRRMIGLPVSARRVSKPAAPAPTLPTLPTLPRYPAASAAPASSVRATAAASVASAAIQAAATAGAAALAARAAATAATPQAAASAAPAETGAPTAPTGEPVPADRLPRITWTYEHEAIKPAQVAVATSAAASASAAAERPDTLAELAPASADVVAAAEEPAVAPAPEAAPVAPPATSATPVDTYSPSAPAPTIDDAPPLEDEPLAAPTALDFPEDDYPEESVLPHAFSVDEAPTAPASAFAIPEEEAPALAEGAPLDPAMLTPAPATTPLPQDEPQDEPTLAMPAPASGVAEAATAEPTPASLEMPEALAHTEPPDAASAETEASPELAPTDDMPARSTFSRITRPVEDLDAALDTIGRTGVVSGPRPSAPESGLWERLSQALIDRSGAPSSPFAAPQSTRPSATDDADASEPDGTAQG